MHRLLHLHLDQNTAEGNSAIGGQLTSADVDTHATATMTNNIPNVESASYSYVSAFIEDFDSSFAAGELNATLKHADGSVLGASETVQFVDAKFTTTAGVTTEVADIASIDGLPIDANGSLTLDPSGAFYDGLATADDSSSLNTLLTMLTRQLQRRTNLHSRHE